MVIRAAHQDLLPGPGEAGLQVVLVGQLLDLGGIQPAHHRAEHLVLGLVPGPVELHDLEQKQQLLEMVRTEQVVDGVQGVGHAVGDPLFLQIRGQVVYVFPQPLDLAVRVFIDVPGQHVHLAAVFRKIGGRFLANEAARQVRGLQASLDGVVVGEGKGVHAQLAGVAVQEQGIAETLRSAQLLQNPLRGALGKPANEGGGQSSLHCSVTGLGRMERGMGKKGPPGRVAQRCSAGSPLRVTASAGSFRTTVFIPGIETELCGEFFTPGVNQVTLSGLYRLI